MYRASDYLPYYAYDHLCIADKLGLKVGLNRCPLRQDSHPSCSLFSTKDGRWILFDHALGQTLDLLSIAARQGLDTLSCVGPCAVNEVADLNRTLEVYTTHWDDTNLGYWLKHGVTEEILDKFNVLPIKGFKLDGEVFSKSGYVYTYKSGAVKLYFPNGRPKALSTASVNEPYPYWALNQNDHLIITSSVKDAMVLYSVGYNSICFGSETVSLERLQSVLSIIQRRFKKVYVLFDIDATGLKHSTKISKAYGFINLTDTFKTLFEGRGVKDPADIVIKFGRSTLKRCLYYAKSK